MSGKILLFSSMMATALLGMAQNAVSMPSENPEVSGAVVSHGKVHADAVPVPVEWTVKPKRQLKTVVFSVNMHCEKCVEKIRENISYEKGVKGLDISLEEKTVSVRYDASKTDEQTLSDAIAELGYEVKVKSRSCEGEDKVQYE